MSAKILEIRNNTILSPSQKQWLIAIYKRCLKRISFWQFEILLSEGLYNDARASLSSENSDEAKTAIYTTYVYENDLVGAANYLSQLSGSSEDLEDFKKVQLINLKRLPHGPFYVASNTDLSTVLSIAKKTHPYAGYAKALYYHLTGTVLQSDLPAIFNKHITPRSVKKEGKASIYPNPFSQQFNVKYHWEKDGTITVHDLFGKSIFSSIISGDMVIPAYGWSEGMYIVTIQSDNTTKKKKKIILIH